MKASLRAILVKTKQLPRRAVNIGGLTYACGSQTTYGDAPFASKIRSTPIELDRQCLRSLLTQLPYPFNKLPWTSSSDYQSRINTTLSSPSWTTDAHALLCSYRVQKKSPG